MATLTRRADRLVALARERAWLDEEHVWYELALPAAEAAEFADDGGLALVRADAERLKRIDALPSMGVRRAEEHVARGGEPWMVLDGDDVLFACWLFRREAPTLAARGGWLALPEGAVVLEDSVAAPAARGRGIAPRTWRALAALLAGEGHAAMLTKVETSNAASRRAVAKAGFREVAIMRLLRRGPRDRVSVEVLDDAGYAGALRTALER